MRLPRKLQAALTWLLLLSLVLLLAWRAVQQGERAWGWGSLALLALKLSSEMAGLSAPQSAEWIGTRVAHEGHLCGALSGLLLALMPRRLR